MSTWRCLVSAWFALCALFAAAPLLAAERVPSQVGYEQRPEVIALIEELESENAFDARSLKRTFAEARYLPAVVAAMSRPIASPPKWYEYSPPFLDPGRVDAGLVFWRAHAATLARAQSEFGVPAEIVVAIIGVETYYGRNTGRFRVLDALTTLAFDYPRRAPFFRNELKEFLLLAREQHRSPLTFMGSYAGAMGLPQFMPDSVRLYALDYDADGRIDLAADPDDAIGSVANFLLRHQWQARQPVMVPVRIESDKELSVLRTFDGGVAERRSIAGWLESGVNGFTIPSDLSADPVGLLMLENTTGTEYWMVFNNWYVLTRYNRSRLYASAVWHLAQMLKEAAKEDAALASLSAGG